MYKEHKEKKAEEERILREEEEEIKRREEEKREKKERKKEKRRNFAYDEKTGKFDILEDTSIFSCISNLMPNLDQNSGSANLL